MTREPSEYQEAHSPTEAVMTKVTNQRQLESTRRRVADGLVVSGMYPDHEYAMQEIFDGFNYITGNVSVRISGCYQPVRPDKHKGDYQEKDGLPWHAWIRPFYFEWVDLGQRGKFNHDAAIAIIVFGQNLKQVDTDRKKRHGFAKENLINALDVWRELRGWR